MEVLHHEVGDTGLSVGTSLAFTPANITTMRTNKVTQILVNVLTVIRNAYSSTKDKNKITPEILSEWCFEDVTTIKAMVGSDIKLVFYLPTHASIDSVFKHANLRKATTAKQIALQKLEDDTLKLLNKDAAWDIGMVLVDIALPAAPTERVVVFTNLPIDLLSVGSFASMVLLESYTGKLKNQTQWYTKLQNGKEMESFPFNIFTIQVYGDNITFSPIGTKTKRAITELAIKNKWSAMISMVVIKYQLQTLDQVVDKEIFTQMLAAKIK